MRQPGNFCQCFFLGKVIISGPEGFFLAFAAGVSEIEKFVLSPLWAAHIYCAPRSLCCKVGTVFSKKLWKEMGKVGEREVVERNRCMLHADQSSVPAPQRVPLSSAVRAMQINTSPCWLFLLSSHHPRTQGPKVEKPLEGHQIPSLPPCKTSDLGRSSGARAPVVYSNILPRCSVQALSIPVLNWCLSASLSPNPNCHLAAMLIQVLSSSWWKTVASGNGWGQVGAKRMT